MGRRNVCGGGRAVAEGGGEWVERGWGRVPVQAVDFANRKPRTLNR